MPWLFALAGLAAGVLINTCADSLPNLRRSYRPTCAVCGELRPPVSWSSLVAHIIRRPHCTHCGAPRPLRHMLVELVTPALFVLCWSRTGIALSTLYSVLYSALLVLITVTDIEHRLIMHVVSLPAIGLALVGAYTNPMFDAPARALLGGAIGLGSAASLYAMGALLGRLLESGLGRPLPGPVLGFGDVTLSTFLGLILGAPEIIFAIVLGVCAGSAIAALVVIVNRLLQAKRSPFTTYMPYGPALILGGAAMLYFGQELMSWYTSR